MTTQPNQDDVAAELRQQISDQLKEFLGEYEHGLEAAKSQGHNTEYHTFDSEMAFIESIEAILQQSNRQLLDEVEREAIGESIKHADYCDLNSDVYYVNSEDVTCSCSADDINASKSAQRTKLRAIKERRGL